MLTPLMNLAYSENHLLNATEAAHGPESSAEIKDIREPWPG